MESTYHGMILFYPDAYSNSMPVALLGIYH